MHLPRTFSTVLALSTTVLVSTVARGEGPTVSECLEANDRSIALRDKHQLLAAREALLLCTSASCPAEVREECARHIAEVNAAIPSVAFQATDGKGEDLSAVKVTMDGKPFVDQLQGASVPLDPGKHSFVFESPGLPRIEKQIIVVEGTKDRHERIQFGTPAGPENRDTADAGAAVQSDPGRVRRIAGWAAVGVGAVGVGVGVVFEILRSGKLSDADAICASGDCGNITSTQVADNNASIHDLTSQANTYGTIGVISLVTGGVLVAGGLALVLTAPSGEGKVAVAPWVAPGVEGFSAVGRF